MTKIKISKCPICQNNAYEKEEFHRYMFHYRCNSCGLFSISGEALMDNSKDTKILPLNNVQVQNARDAIKNNSGVLEILHSNYDDVFNRMTQNARLVENIQPNKKGKHKMRVFISYSHDSETYKKKVLALHDKIEAEGDFDVIIDQKDLIGGKRNAKFMNEEIKKADKVIVLVSKKYAEKVRKGKGGAAYEEAVINNELVKDVGQEKFIPVMVSIKASELPDSLSGISALKFKQGKTGWDNDYSKLLLALRNIPEPDFIENENKDDADFHIPDLNDEEKEIMLHLLDKEGKRDFFPVHLGDPEGLKKSQVVNDLYEIGCLRFFNLDHNGVELNAPGEAIAIKLKGGTEKYLPETIEIMEEIMLEAYEDNVNQIYLELHSGCKGRDINKLRIARNLEDNGYLRSIGSGDNFELTRLGKEIAKEFIEKDQEETPDA